MARPSATPMSVSSRIPESCLSVRPSRAVGAVRDHRPMEHAPHNAMDDPQEIARFRDRCSVLMGALLDELARTPEVARPFPAIEDALGWPHRRIASVLGGVWHLRPTEFGGRRPYRFYGDRESASGRWELWMDATQAAAIRDAD
jgi:hypothetical protein